MLLLVALHAGCNSGNSCADYVLVRQDCSDESGGDTVYDAETICGNWTSEQEDVYGDWYSCQAAAFTAVDCNAAQAYLDAESGAATCDPPAESAG
ncbi:MAG: hypothetical protein EXR71_11655 [Myxococcales bacterium]|nr:hypothetical protein [Myxococcales bacterium]